MFPMMLNIRSVDIHQMKNSLCRGTESLKFFATGDCTPRNDYLDIRRGTSVVVGVVGVEYYCSSYGVLLVY